MQRECDFCSDPAIHWRYPAGNHILGLYQLSGQILVTESIGDWGACEECHRLIENGDRLGLLRRSVQNLGIQPLPLELFQELGRIHTEFFAYRSGPPIPVEKGAYDA